MGVVNNWLKLIGESQSIQALGTNVNLISDLSSGFKNLTSFGNFGFSVKSHLVAFEDLGLEMTCQRVPGEEQTTNLVLQSYYNHYSNVRFGGLL